MAVTDNERIRLIALRGRLEQALFYLEEAKELVDPSDSEGRNSNMIATVETRRHLQRVLQSLQLLDDADGSTVK